MYDAANNTNPLPSNPLTFFVDTTVPRIVSLTAMAHNSIADKSIGSEDDSTNTLLSITCVWSESVTGFTPDGKLYVFFSHHQANLI